MKSTASFVIGSSVVFSQLNYYNDTGILGIDNTNSHIIIYDKLHAVIRYNISTKSTIFANIAYYNGTQYTILAVNTNLIYQYHADTSTNTTIFNLNSIDSADTFKGFAQINSSALYLYTAKGKIYFAKVNNSTNVLALTNTLVNNVTFQIKNLIIDSNNLFYCVLGVSL
jgi:uncharacterized protein with WD repeat